MTGSTNRLVLAICLVCMAGMSACCCNTKPLQIIEGEEAKLDRVKEKLIPHVAANWEAIEEAAEAAHQDNWGKAVDIFLSSNELDNNDQRLMMRYFPFAFRWATKTIHNEVNIPDPNFEYDRNGSPTYSKADLDKVIALLSEQIKQNATSVEDAANLAYYGIWKEAALKLLAGMPNPSRDNTLLYLRYLPFAIRHASWQLGIEVEITDP
jgi:hypothetical protein